jgi:hypothetical protein
MLEVYKTLVPMAECELLPRKRGFYDLQTEVFVDLQYLHSTPPYG